MIAGQEKILPVYDYFGEEPLKPGRYSYVLSIVKINQIEALTIELEKP